MSVYVGRSTDWRTNSWI